MSEANKEDDLRQEINRVRRVSDMMVTAHSNLRDKYDRLALLLDLSILSLSVWLTSVVFIEPRISLKLTPFQFDPQIWVGLLGVFTLFLSIVQLRVDWKGASERHQRAADMHSKVKKECRRLLESGAPLTRESCQTVLTQYDISSDLGPPIPERQFLKQKGKHLRKVAISRYLDSHPGEPLLLIRSRMWWRGNLDAGKAPSK